MAKLNNISFDQRSYSVRFEWGLDGLFELAPHCDVLIIVDVLSFTTCVEIGTSRGAIIFPFGDNLSEAPTFARSKNAELATKDRSQDRYSLSPSSLLQIPSGLRLVLPSPNGARLSRAAPEINLLAGSLRNAAAVAQAAQQLGDTVGIIAAGEQWPNGKRLRPSLEDMIGAGAIIHHLQTEKSPEATAAEAVFIATKENLLDIITQSGSGRELIQKGFPNDLKLACELEISRTVPRFAEGAYSAWEIDEAP